MTHSLLLRNIGHTLTMIVMALIACACSEEDAPQNPAPILQLNEVSSIERTMADVSGTIEGNFESASKYYLMYSTTRGSITEKDENVCIQPVEVSETLGGGGSVYYRLTGLTPGTTYYVCLAAEIGNGTQITTLQSNIVQFTTLSSETPTLGELEAIETGEEHVTLRCRINDNGGTEITQLAFQYKTKTNTNFNTLTVDKYDDEYSKTFSLTIDRLEPSTTYIFRAMAVNRSEEGIGYSNELEITTEAPVSPTVRTERSYTAQANRMKVNGTVLKTGGTDDHPGQLQRCGICWSTNGIPTAVPGQGNFRDADALPTEIPGLFTVEITGLTAETTYQVRAYAVSLVNGREVYGYGDIVEMCTTAMKKVKFSTPTVANVTQDSFTVSSRITDTGNTDITETGFVWTTDPQTSPENIAQKITIAPDDQYRFSHTFTQMTPKTTYYIYAYAVNDEGTHFSNSCSVLTKYVPDKDDQPSPDQP